jgi:hypothetical protein
VTGTLLPEHSCAEHGCVRPVWLGPGDTFVYY